MIRCGRTRSARTIPFGRGDMSPPRPFQAPSSLSCATRPAGAPLLLRGAPSTRDAWARRQRSGLPCERSCGRLCLPEEPLIPAYRDSISTTPSSNTANRHRPGGVLGPCRASICRMDGRDAVVLQPRLFRRAPYGACDTPLEEHLAARCCSETTALALSAVRSCGEF